ncbi:MAG: bifunctional riboflavin kinase/FAD synthetase [Salinibacterium sp.]|nr:MAG: bifunctional riboflavin kinase/FAD synthetase [Salinibacterium sp.]
MLTFRSPAELPVDFGPSAVTVGKFDGVHGGHRAVIQRLRAIAEERGLSAVVVTFDRHPLSLLNPDSCPEALVSNERKIDLLASTGIDATLILTFDRALSDLSPEAFVTSTIVNALHGRVVLVGADFRFGAGGAGDVTLLRELGRKHGFEVLMVDDVTPDGERRVSSTWIRELLADGQVEAAAALMGSLPTVRGVVVHGQHRGRSMGIPTANLSPELEGYVPADGVYAAWLKTDGRVYPAAVSVGNNPTFEGVPDKQVEAHVLDEEFELYGETVEISFVKRVRPMEKFADARALAAQMQEDVRQIAEVLSSE